MYWLLKQNKELNHKFIFLNLSALLWVASKQFQLNEHVRVATKIFNTTLQELAEQKGHSILDVYKLTDDDTGYSNNLYHVDNYHLGPNIILKLKFE